MASPSHSLKILLLGTEPCSSQYLLWGLGDLCWLESHCRSCKGANCCLSTWLGKYRRNFLPLSKEEESSIKLLNALKSQKAPLRAYPALLEWHLKETGHLREHKTLKDSQKYFHRDTLMKKLIKCYNMQAMLPKIKKLTLPHSKAVVHIPYGDIQDCIVLLLTDPRICNRDCLFFDQDPTAPPPEKVKFIEDINTGEAYLESYKKYITKPNQDCGVSTGLASE